jgi:hypothetical protein
MLYMPIIGVVKVQEAIIGANMKLTREVPNFCRRNKPTRIVADKVSTATVTIS